MIIRCPYCNADHAVSEQVDIGVILQCPRCKKRYSRANPSRKQKNNGVRNQQKGNNSVLQPNQVGANQAENTVADDSIRNVSENVTAALVKASLSKVEVEKFVTFFSELIVGLESMQKTAPDMVIARDAPTTDFSNRHKIAFTYARDFFGRIHFVKQSNVADLCIVREISSKFNVCPEDSFRFISNLYGNGSLNHRNILQLKSVAKIGDRWEVISESFFGKTLYQVIQKIKRMDAKSAVFLISRVCHALRHAALKNIGHYSLSLHRVLIDRSGSVKLLDLGFSYVVRSNWDAIFGEGKDGLPNWAFVNSTNFLSPEQCRNEVDLTSASDMYTIGCLLYRMISGEHAISGKTNEEIIDRHLNWEFRFLEADSSPFPKELQRIITKLLAIDPRDRYANWDEVLYEFEVFLKPTQIASDKEVAQLILDASKELGAASTARFTQRFLKSGIAGLWLVCSIFFIATGSEMFVVSSWLGLLSLIFAAWFRSQQKVGVVQALADVRLSFRENRQGWSFAFGATATLLLTPFIVMEPETAAFVLVLSALFGWLFGSFVVNRVRMEESPFIQRCNDQINRLRSNKYSEFRIETIVWEAIGISNPRLFGQLFGRHALESRLHSSNNMQPIFKRLSFFMRYRCLAYLNAAKDLILEILNQRQLRLNVREQREGKSRSEQAVIAKQKQKSSELNFVKSFNSKYRHPTKKKQNHWSWIEISEKLFGSQFRLTLGIGLLTTYGLASLIAGVDYRLEEGDQELAVFMKKILEADSSCDAIRSRFFGGPGFLLSGLILVVSSLWRRMRLYRYLIPATFTAIFLGPFIQFIRININDYLPERAFPHGTLLATGISISIVVFGVVFEALNYVGRGLQKK